MPKPTVSSSATSILTPPRKRRRKTEPVLLAAHEGGDQLDGVPGGFSQRLQQMGVVQPNPTYSSSSTAAESFTHHPEGLSASPGPANFPPAPRNQTVSALEARQQLQRLAEQDLEATGRSSNTTRRFLDMRTLVEAMKLRDQGIALADIESRLQLQPNLLQKLGRASILSHAN